MISTNLKTLTSGFLLVTTLLFLGCNSNSGSSSGDTSLETNIDSVSYSQGYQIGNFLRQQGMSDLNTDKLLVGLNAGINDQEAQLSNMEMQQIVQAYQQQAQQKALEKQQQESEQNLQEGQDFLAENRNKDGIMETDSGLQYQVLEEGTGESPDSTDAVRVHYEGTLLDGTIFDSSYDRGQPATFPLSGGLIEGWKEGVPLMKEGAKYKFWIPGSLGYGQNAPPNSPIGPNETLVFEIELLEVNPEDTATGN
jgi:FKBP-type peptidyl-prolyl cis-trans isomerase